jgi:hypothetical protein
MSSLFHLSIAAVVGKHRTGLPMPSKITTPPFAILRAALHLRR